MTAKYAFVSAERSNHAVATLCRVAGVSVSGFYAWLRAIPVVQGRAEAEAKLCRRDYQEFRAGLGMMGAKEPDDATPQRTSYS